MRRAPLSELQGAKARTARSPFTERCPENKKTKKHKIPFDVLSDVHICEIPGCGKRIKQRLVNIKKRPPKRCYQHRHTTAKPQKNTTGV